jgi:hypothetical protein
MVMFALHKYGACLFNHAVIIVNSADACYPLDTLFKLLGIDCLRLKLLPAPPMNENSIFKWYVFFT